MRLEVATEDVRKKAFRTAYDFLDRNRYVLDNPDEYKRVANEAREKYNKCPDDLLTMHLLIAVCECIFDVSERVTK